MIKPIVVVSSCLNFENVRYNGQVVPSKIVADLERHLTYKKVCPETGIGLGVPREPIRIVKVGKELRLIQHVTNRDVTDEMNAFTRTFLDELGEVDGFILKSRSPTMGLKGIKVYSDIKKGAPVVERCSGFFAGAVAERYAGFPLEDEGRLINKKIREHFLTRIFLFAAYREAKKENRLDAFHQRNTMLFRFYNPEMTEKLVPEAKDYIEIMRETVKTPPNSEQIFAFFKNYENAVANKEKYRSLLERYRINKVSLDTIKEALGLLITDEKALQSSFFNPFPPEMAYELDLDRDKDFWSTVD